MLAYYLHDLSPVAVRFSETFIMRWYGLSYVAGLFLAWLIMRWLGKRGLSEIKPESATFFMLLIGFVGVMIGGRFAYVVAWHFDEFRGRPLDAMKPWSGGMASHGCIAGSAIVSLCYARWHRISWPGVLDTLVCAFSPGVFFVRLGNFINGEGVGRVTHAPWAVKFPTELLRADPISAAARGFPPLPPGARSSPEIIAFFEKLGIERAQLGAMLLPRHPAQLYEAIAGGLLLFVALVVLRVRFPRLAGGTLAAVACIWYAAARIVIENFRQPESWETAIFGMSRGQLYSLCMLAIGLAFLVHARLSRRRFI